jgi:CheY-like chemotaxis protein
MGIENRKQVRVPFKKNVLINGSIMVLGLDLSIGGLYVHTGRHFRANSIVKVTLPLNGEFLNLQARVQHAQDNIGMGLMFIDLDLEQAGKIEAFIAGASTQAGPEKKKVLLVDDNEASIRMHKGKLIQDGYSVITARDGIEALALLEKESVQLVVLDLYMEKLDGLKVLSIIRSKPEWQNIPVLIFSARSNSTEIERAMDAGATDFLVKMTTSPMKLSERVKLRLAS